MTRTLFEPTARPDSAPARAKILPFRKEWTQRLTPREVERRYPVISRALLAERRKLGLSPRCKYVAGCAMYSMWEIERFAATVASAAAPPQRKAMPPRCAVYARASSLYQPFEPISSQVKSCEAHLRDNGWEFASACVDFGPPNTAKRLLDGFRQLLKEAADHEFDILLIPDRTHVTTNARSYQHFAQTLQGLGIKVREFSPRKAGPWSSRVPTTEEI